MSQAISDVLNPNRNPREAFGLKAEKTLNRITLNPSSVNLEETLYVNIPKLAEGVVIVPGSVALLFNLNVAGHANNTLVNNVGRNLVTSLKVKFGEEILQDTQRYDLLKTYNDLFLSKEEREDRLKQGISSVNMRKLRTNAGDKVTTDAGEVALALVHNTKYRIALDHPVLNNHGVFYPKVLPNHLLFELTFEQVVDIVIYSDVTKAPNYTITNLELEYQCISSDSLANQAKGSYQSKKGFFYENILLHKTFTISKPNDSVINEKINVPRRYMTGILCLFTERHTAGTRDSEKFVNPDIKSVSINVDGIPNRLYSKGMAPSDTWENIKKRMGGSGSMKFYTGNKYALWIDLRTYPDNDIHGGGLTLNNTRDGGRLEIKRKVEGSGNMTCHLYVVADALMDSDLKSVMY